MYVDNNNDSVGKRFANLKAKVPYTLVIGEKEEAGEVTPRIRGDLEIKESSTMKLENFLKQFVTKQSHAPRTLRCSYE